MLANQKQGRAGHTSRKLSRTSSVGSRSEVLEKEHKGQTLCVNGTINSRVMAGPLKTFYFIETQNNKLHFCLIKFFRSTTRRGRKPP